MPYTLLDTNILARFLIGDVPDQQQKAIELFERAAMLEIELCILPEVLIELNYVLSKHYDVEKERVIEEYKEITTLGFVRIENSETMIQALEIYAENIISLEDSYYISFCLNNNMELESFDKKTMIVWKKYQLSSSKV